MKWKVRIPGSGKATPIIWENSIFVQTAIPTGRRVEGETALQSPGTGSAQPVAGQSGQSAESSPRAPGDPAAASGERGGGPGGRRGRGGFGGGPKPTEFHQFALLCLERETGNVRWQKIAREEVPHEGLGNRDSTYAPSSPVTDGKHVYSYFGSRGLYCYDLQGNLKWQKDLGRMQTKNSFGEGSSPALAGDTLVVNWDHEGSDFIVAFDKNTGRELWRQTREEDTSWSTPLVVEHEGKRQVVTSATGKVRSYDLGDGKLLWECGKLTPNAIPSPVTGHGMVFATSGFRGHALLAIRLGRSGELTGSDAIAWHHDKSTPYVSSPLLYGDRLYFFADNSNLFSCFDAKAGQAVFEAERIEGLNGVYASPVGAGGRVYLVGRNGTALVLKQSDKVEVLATNVLEEGFDASPAIAGNELYLRGREHLYCIARN